MKKILLIVFSLYFMGCNVHKHAQHTPTPTVDDCKDVTPSFATQIQPIIIARCANCHNGGKLRQNFSTYDGMKRYLANNSIHTYVIVDRTMPKDEPLEPAQLQLIKCWLKNGAPNN